MKYLKKYELFEALELSNDLQDMINYFCREKSKVAVMLLWLSQSDEYSNKEDINYIDFSKELNKFSFIPLKKRKDGVSFDKDSMPTRIGRLVNNIFNKAKELGLFHLEKDYNGQFRKDPEQPGVYEFRISKEFDYPRHFIYSHDEWLPKAKVEATFEGTTIDFELVDIEQRSDYIKGEGWKSYTIIQLKTDADVSELEEMIDIELPLKIESNLIINDKDVEEFVNNVVAYLKINRADENSEIEEVKGEDIRFWYHPDNYQTMSGELGSSCMAKVEAQPYLDIYCKNQDRISLLILKSKEGKLIARALLWKLDNDKFFMDRVYAILQSDANIFYKKAKEKGWIYKNGKSSIKFNGSEYDRELKVSLEYLDFRKYPYLDTLSFLDWRTDKLRSGMPRHPHYYELCDTEGGYDDGTLWD
jgi:hypothetical protein